MVSFLFFKQKTAYEMRISDWSSDVCSSDLHDRRDFGGSSSRHCSARERVLLPERRPHGPDPADYGGYPRYPRRPRPNGAEARAAEAGGVDQEVGHTGVPRLPRGREASEDAEAAPPDDLRHDEIGRAHV